MLGWLDRSDLSRDVIVAFFDAEDLGGIDGKEYSLGAEFLAANPLPGLQPSEALVLDMVGGAGMVFDVDAHILGHPPSRELTGEIFRVGASRGFSPFAADKPGRFKYIVSDHRPFALRGIASCILIDIDYPQWHTLDDLPSALSAESLEITEEVLLLFLSRFRG
jgi:Zn-dependent M28 family amino/carboxypeptidase